jgi:hypothetical protein
MSGKTRKLVHAEKKENRYPSIILPAALLICVVFFTTYKIEDNDLYWHLATGKFIVEHKYVPDKDVFGLITSDAEWIPFEWGWDVISYGVHSLAGLEGLYIFNTIVYLVIFLLFYFLFRKFSVPASLAVILLFALLMAVMDRLSPRPHSISYLFLSVLLYLLISYRYKRGETPPSRLYAIPVVFLLWCNIHMGVFTGLLLLLTYMAVELLVFKYPRRFSNRSIPPIEKHHLRTLMIITAVSVAF